MISIYYSFLVDYCCHCCQRRLSTTWFI